MAFKFGDPGRRHSVQVGKYIHEFYRPLVVQEGGKPQLRSPQFPTSLFDVCIYESEETGARGRLIRTEPNYEAIIEITDLKLPRFLYRTSSNESGGRSSEYEFSSQSVQSGLGETEFFSLPREDVQEKTYAHLHGYHSRKGSTFHSPWISFTDSWLFVMYWALFLRSKSCTNIKIHIIDTHTIREPTLIFHSYTFSKALRIGVNGPEWWYKRMLRGTYTEFLVWNKITVGSGDMVQLETLLKAERTPQGSLTIWPSTLTAFNERRLKSNDKKCVRKVDPPSISRKKLFDDKGLIKWLEEDAGRGPGTFKYMRGCMQATRMRQPRPPAWYTGEYNRFIQRKRPVDDGTINGALDIACCFKTEFQLDITVWSLALRAGTYEVEDTAQKLASHPKVLDLMREMKCYTTGLESHKKIEVQVNQEIWLNMAIQLGFKVVCNSSQSPRTNLIPGKNCLDSAQQRISRPPTVVGKRFNLDKLQKDETENMQGKESLRHVQMSSDKSYNTGSKRKFAAEEVPQLSCQDSPVAPNKQLAKRIKLRCKVRAAKPKVVFYPKVDSYTIDGVLHEGIASYLDLTMNESIDFTALPGIRQLLQHGDVADEGTFLKEGEVDEIGDEGELNREQPPLIKIEDVM